MKVLAFTLLLALAPMTASAVTLEQIVALSKAGVSEAVILALIDRDKSIITIDPEQLITLKAEGVSEKVVLAMLKSGREEAAAADRADAEMRAANYQAAAAVVPDAILIGHGPDRPNAGYEYYDRSYAGPPVVFSSDFSPVPFAVPYPVPYAVSPSRGAPIRPMFHRSRRAPVAPTSGQLCLQQVTAGHALPSIGFVTVCPPR